METDNSRNNSFSNLTRHMEMNNATHTQNNTHDNIKNYTQDHTQDYTQNQTHINVPNTHTRVIRSNNPLQTNNTHRASYTHTPRNGPTTHKINGFNEPCDLHTSDAFEPIEAFTTNKKEPLLPTQEADKSEDVLDNQAFKIWDFAFQKGGEFDLSDGPIRRTSPTDFVFFILFLFGLTSMFYVCVMALKNGNLNSLTYGRDHRGRICGVDEEVKQFPLLYWPSSEPQTEPISSPLDKQYYTAVCTNICPTEFSQNRTESCPPDDIQDGLCSWYCSDPPNLLVNRFCQPQSAYTHTHITTALILNDFLNSWPIILASIFCTLLLCVLYIWIFHVCGKYILIMSFFLFQSILILMGVALWFFKYTHTLLEGIITIAELPQNVYIVCKILAVLIWIITAGIIIFIIYQRKNVYISFRLLNSSAKFLTNYPAMYFINFCILFVNLAITIFTTLSIISLASSGNETTDIYYIPYQICGHNKTLIVCVILMGIWSIYFFNALSKLFTAYCTGAWYFATKYQVEEYRMKNIYRKAILTCCLLHSGSAALGALIQGAAMVCKCLFVILRINKKENQWKLVRWWASFIAFISPLFLYINQMALIYVALSGQNYFVSAFMGSALSLRHGLNLIIIKVFGTIVKFFGVFIITTAILACSFFAIKGLPIFTSEIISYYPVLIVIGVFSYILSNFLMAIWSNSIDSIWQCYMADSDMYANSVAYSNKPPDHIKGLPTLKFNTKTMSEIRSN